jgi:hypothetical protein
MGLDIRIPLGLLFTAIGLILVAFGAFTHGSAIYAISLGFNLNLVWGLVLMLFGAVMLAFARLSSRGRW